MIISDSAGAVQTSFADLWFVVVQFAPTIIFAMIIAILGWVCGVAFYNAIVVGARMLRLDGVMRSAGLTEMAREAGFTLDVGRFLASLVMWFFMLVGFAAALEILGLRSVTSFIEQVVILYIPQVITASLILIAAAVAADFVKKIIVRSARVAGAGSAHGAQFTGSIAKWAIWIVAILASLTQLGIAPAFEQTLFTGIVIALSLAFGLAFGLGGKETAARILEHMRSEISHKE
jgi:hypothetical protein